MARFGQMVKSARERKGISQGDLATAMGVSASVLSEMETGKRISAPDASWVRVISERVGINAVSLPTHGIPPGMCLIAATACSCHSKRSPKLADRGGTST